MLAQPPFLRKLSLHFYSQVHVITPNRCTVVMNNIYCSWSLRVNLRAASCSLNESVILDSICPECVLLWYEAHYSILFQATYSFFVNINFCHLTDILVHFTAMPVEKNKHVICRPWSVRIGKNCALGLKYDPRNGLNANVKIPRTMIVERFRQLWIHLLTMCWITRSENKRSVVCFKIS